MIVVDTSVWIDHIREADQNLVSLLESISLFQHPMVTIEVALGSIKSRSKLIEFLANLPNIDRVEEIQLLDFIEKHELHGTGIGLVDAHLLAAVTRDCLQLWTRDKRLKAQAERLGCAFTPD